MAKLYDVGGKAALLVALLAPIAPVAAEPMRLNVDGIGTPELAWAAAGASAPSLFEVAGARKAPREADDEASAPLVTALEPQAAGLPFDAAAKADVAEPAPMTLSSEHELNGVSPAEEVAMAETRTLGQFAPQPLAAVYAEPDPVDSVNLADEDEAEAPQMQVPLPDTDLEALRTQRSAIEWVVVPLVLGVMLAVFMARGGRTRVPSRRRKRAA